MDQKTKDVDSYTALGRKQLVAERSKWEAFSRAMLLVLNPADQGETQ